jgi:hypothetical protein
MDDGLLPDFLGIGAVKAGTTWLHRNLYQHPALYLPAVKPVRYFDRHIDKPIEAYKAIFRPGADRVRGEFSASYSVLSPETIAYVGGLMPHLKLIFLMREPKARAWSEAKMEFSVIRGASARPITDDEYCEFIASRQCRSRGNYCAIIKNWMTVFPASRIFVDLFDDVRDQPKALLVRVLGFLGVASDIDYADFPLKERIFAGLATTVPDRCRQLLDDIYQLHDIDEMSDLTEMDLAHRWGYR